MIISHCVFCCLLKHVLFRFDIERLKEATGISIFILRFGDNILLEIVNDKLTFFSFCTRFQK